MSSSLKRAANADGSSKRARFASPSQLESSANNFLEDDVAHHKTVKDRSALKGQEGYDSDSSNDGEGVVPSRKTAHGEDEDDDMFGGVSEAQDVDNTQDAIRKSDEKNVRFMNLGDIEGQEFAATSSRKKGKGKGKGRAKGGDNDESDDEEDADVDDQIDDEDSDSEDEQRRKTQKQGLDGPMGFELTSFNMRKELRQGRMTADGETYVEEDKDPHEEHDRWLEGTDKEAVKKARRAKRERERLEQEREERERAEEHSADRKPKERQVISGIVDLLDRGETVLEGLQRLGQELEKEQRKAGATKKKQTWAEKQKERKALLEGHAATASGDGMQVDSATHSNVQPFGQLSNFVSELTSFGHMDVYSMTRESLQRMLPREGAAQQPSAAAAAQEIRLFQYRFSKSYLASLPADQRPVERETFGPFPLSALMQWRGTGFFGGPACENVELRKMTSPSSAGGVAQVQPDGEWGSWSEVVSVP